MRLILQINTFSKSFRLLSVQILSNDFSTKSIHNYYSWTIKINNQGFYWTCMAFHFLQIQFSIYNIRIIGWIYLSDYYFLSKESKQTFIHLVCHQKSGRSMNYYCSSMILQKTLFLLQEKEILYSGKSRSSSATAKFISRTTCWNIYHFSEQST